MIKSQQKEFKYTHANGDVFTYSDSNHRYEINGQEVSGTTTPLKLINELSWDANGKMTDKMEIIKNWAIKLVVNGAIEKIKSYFSDCDASDDHITCSGIEEIILEAKKLPNQRFKSAGLSGTEIHELCEEIIKGAIINSNGVILNGSTSEHPQVQNFINWARTSKVKFLYSEEPIYSKEWMTCGTVDFICEIGGKTLIGDIKTNGDKRRYEWNDKLHRYDETKPVSDIYITALWQTGAYGKMATEDNARKLIEKFDGVCVVNIKKSGEFDESLDVRYNYNPKVLVEAYDHVIKLYKLFRNQI